MPRYTRFTRVVVLPAVILLVAAGLSWWSSRQRDASAERIQVQVTAWCIAAGQGKNPVASLPADEFIARPLGAALVEVCRIAPDEILVETALGPGPGQDVEATHHAIILRDDTPVLGINFRASGQQTTIAGFWKEQ